VFSENAGTRRLFFAAGGNIRGAIFIQSFAQKTRLGSRSFSYRSRNGGLTLSIQWSTQKIRFAPDNKLESERL